MRRPPKKKIGRCLFFVPYFVFFNPSLQQNPRKLRARQRAVAPAGPAPPDPAPAAALPEASEAAIGYPRAIGAGCPGRGEVLDIMCMEDTWYVAGTTNRKLYTPFRMTQSCVPRRTNPCGRPSLWRPGRNKDTKPAPSCNW